ncbi:Bromodomain, conserved site,High mobility group box domain,Bromodomain,Bromo adjacent homology (BAH) [Cinara cedri]|uniref:Bromodomain, conserved site,High mobility group box domain,Bromodomain,Bromo adjacent homology (BAH) n=1 Tax=Cinara cedri TaxID=506608 RepID=A0A5E4NQD1_9HEMI|nr:Bromodomain, conserved site,High mobility group box domain,Bromodomain,Bromo adjacent homology (BAH) [Cinara cedri]
MNRRRRASSIASRATDDEVESSPVEQMRKKRRMDPVDIVQSVYDTIRNLKKEDGTLLCDSFIRAPKRRQEPTYYDVVSNPIDMIKIQQKIKTDEYDDVDDLQADLELLTNNAKSFYKKNSQEYKDAVELWEVFLNTKNNLLEREGTPKEKIVIRVGKLGKRGGSAASVSKSEQTDEEESNSSLAGGDDELAMCEDLFTAVMSATDNDNRLLSEAFQLLPSKKLYPNYYEVIENPIDLRSIARKIQDGKYTNLAEMERELLIMTKNACLFNEPGSQIYKDARTLKKIITSKKIEVDHGKYAPSKSSERIRAKRMRGSQTSMSAVTAALQSEEEEDSDLDEDTVTDSQSSTDGPDNPRWQLYNAVRSATGIGGSLLSDSFWRLPSRRYYSNYYREIRNPLSLMQIGKKLKNGDYGTVSEVAGDMNIMLENAKKYFSSDTKPYKDAVKLQKIMQTKAQELLDLGHQYSDSEDDSADDELQSTSRVSKKFVRSPRCLTRGKYLNNIPLKRRLYALCKCLMDYTTEHGRVPMLMFMERPSKKLYPDYYKVIAEPIDMLTIEEKIKQEKYKSEDEILQDFKLMFDNCRQFNEDGSLIYEDANTLEKVLLDRSKELGPVLSKNNKTVSSSLLKFRKSHLPPATLQKLRTLFNTIKDFKDQKGRLLSIIFMKLPSKIEYPDYYEVIKKPINLEVISQKLKNNLYESLDDLAADYVLMFDNACKYNEPDSQIYKDALTLQRLTLQTKLQLRADEDSTPDVQSAVQELLTSLFTNVYNHQDEEGRCFSDSMAELPEHDDVDGNKVRGLSLDLIKRRLDSNQYKRLDTFQDDLFACLERARQLSRTDSQVFEDSIELQSYFIRQRDEVCRNGDLLNSPALNYSLLDLSLSVNDMRERKMAEESISGNPEEDEIKTEDSIQEEQEDNSAPVIAGTVDDSVCVNQLVYRVGDFVYVEPNERGQELMILNIQRLWTNQESQKMLYGNHFYRPSETYHSSTRKFLEKEVFKSDSFISIPVSQIKGRCAVVSVKDYFRYQPIGFDEKDVYVCESRYTFKSRSFKKIKNWASTLTATWKLVEREEPLDPKRVMSIFRARMEKHKEEIAELEENEKIIEKEKPNVIIPNPPGVIDDGSVYYEQYNAPIGVLKPGDFVYLKNDGQTRIIQIDKIWINKQGTAYIYGPIILYPTDLSNFSGRQFFKQEVLLTNNEETVLVSKITGKCSVLEHADYISCRPAEIAEDDVYLCESIYDESTKQIRELPKDGLKKYTHSSTVNQDEYYFFRRLIHPVKDGATEVNTQSSDIKTVYNQNYDSVSNVSSPVMPKLEPADTMTEDSMDGGPPSVSSSDLGERTLNTSTVMSTPSSSRKKNPNHKKLVTGYILYTGDVRKAVVQNNPDRSFGEVSRIVGNEWRNLSPTEKLAYEERANRLNEENYPQWRQQPIQAPPPPEGSDLIWECGWDNCEWQFEDQSDCLDHAVADQYGHVQTFFSAIPPNDVEFQCQWRGCLRVKKTGIAPFPSLHRLVRHVKEVHILKNPGKHVPLSERNKNFMSSTRSVVATTSVLSVTPVSPPPIENSNVGGAVNVLNQINRNTPSPMSQNGSASNNSIIINKHPEPLFVTVPPKPTRVFHSEAYIKYIESLNLESKPSWERQLMATQENTKGPDDPNSLPAVQWLGKGIGNHGNVLNALWALRNFMMKDAMGLSKTDE